MWIVVIRTSAWLMRNRQIDRQGDRQTLDGQTDIETDIQIESRQIDGQTDRQIEGYTINKQTGRQIDKQTYRQKDKQTYRQKDKQTDGHRDRQIIDRQKNRQTTDIYKHLQTCRQDRCMHRQLVKTLKDSQIKSNKKSDRWTTG